MTIMKIREFKLDGQLLSSSWKSWPGKPKCNPFRRSFLSGSNPDYGAAKSSEAAGTPVSE